MTKQQIIMGATISRSSMVINDQGVKEYYIEGVASNDKIDKKGTVMNRALLNKWVSEINSGKRVVIEEGHNPEWCADMGYVTRSWTVQRGEYTDFHIEAKLDPDHPSTLFLVKRLKNGDEIALSIWGHPQKWHWEGRSATETGHLVFDDLDLKRIAITSKEYALTPDTYVKALQRSIEIMENGGSFDDDPQIQKIYEILNEFDKKLNSTNNENKDTDDLRGEDMTDQEKKVNDVNTESAKVEEPVVEEQKTESAEKNEGLDVLKSIQDSMEELKNRLEAVEKPADEAPVENVGQEKELAAAVGRSEAKIQGLESKFEEFAKTLNTISETMQLLGKQPEARGAYQMPAKPELPKEENKSPYAELSNSDLIARSKTDSKANAELYRRYNAI